jgi:succinyl-diaminopimelate desuccinylase
VPDPIELTRRLVALDTIDHEETSTHAVLAPLLEAAGFRIHVSEHAPGRGNMLAEWETDHDTPPLCLSGHLDTVPLGAAAWSHDPFAGQLDGDRLYGRGTSDMKGGIAALVLAAIQATATRRPRRAGLRLVLTAAEETGAHGARHLLPQLRTRPSGPLLIAEPTANEVVHGHKGALWLEATTNGVTAHGSTPQLGVNAIRKLARAITALDDFAFDTPSHPAMGTPTLNVGTFHAGMNPNSVPDQATATLDIRTIAGQHHSEITARLGKHAGSEITLTPILDLPPVWTNPDDPWAKSVAAITGTVGAPHSATYFTDAAYLGPALGNVPTVICGPGQPELAHATDEWCSATRLHEAVDLYGTIIRQWCGL